MAASTRACASPEFTIVVPTRNRAAQLRRCLDRLTALRCDKPWEIVVVNSGSTDGTLSVLEAIGARSPVPLTIVSLDRMGCGLAKNAGIARARGRIIGFIDDDCYADPDWLAVADRAFSAHPDVAVIGGRVLLWDATDAPCSIQLHDVAERLEPGSFIPPGLIPGANLLVRRTVVDTIGGYDRDLGAGKPLCAEDLDFVARAAAAGFATLYLPELVVHHHHGRKTQHEATSLKRQYAKGRGAYYAKALLDPACRGQVARHIYWQWRGLPKRGDYVIERWLELKGGLLFALLHLRRIGSDPHRIGPVTAGGQWPS